MAERNEAPRAAAAPTPAPPDALRVVVNARPGRDWNTCGQAAIATLLARAGRGPFAGGAAPDDAAAIDAIARAYGPDVPFGLGTTVWRIVAALRANGLDAAHVHGGWFGHRADALLPRIAAHANTGHPVPVCIAARAVGRGRPGAAHWAIVLGVDDDAVRLGNCGVPSLPVGRFVAAWRCPWLPYGHNAAAILTR
jgi:hypothetical protein